MLIVFLLERPALLAATVPAIVALNTAVVCAWHKIGAAYQRSKAQHITETLRAETAQANLDDFRATRRHPGPS